MGDIDYSKIIDDEQLWSDINNIIRDNDTFDFEQYALQGHALDFGMPIASGLRFRYQSEIDKKCFSAIKGERNLPPTIKVRASSDVTLQLDLITDMSSAVMAFPHFNTLYEISKLPTNARIVDGVCLIPIKGNCNIDIKLNCLGIRKSKLKEAIPRIKEKYPHFDDQEAKRFFNENKGTVKLRALLFSAECVFKCIFSKTIKSQIAKENKVIKIQFMSPKTVADYNESLIVVLEKKITVKTSVYLKFEKMSKIPLQIVSSDGQTFVLNLPPIKTTIPISGRIRIQCAEYYDEKDIRFQPVVAENLKRKNPQFDGISPLNRSAEERYVLMPMPESGNSSGTIEVDAAQYMETDEYYNDTIQSDGHVSGNESCKDSGIYSANKSNDSSDFSSSDESDEDDDIEIEGVRRRRVNRVGNLEPIKFPTVVRDINSRLQTSETDRVAAKIFSEVARIGHDYAFGKQPADLFERIEKQLPVVFTLQDDVGDTPLNNAILKGNFVQAEHILEIVKKECRWALDIANTSGHTALILAPACDTPVALITKLLEAGCSLEAKDDLGKSAIIYAIEYKNTPVLEILLQYIQNNNIRGLLQRPKNNYYSPLQIAVITGYVDGVAMMLALKDHCDGYIVDVDELSLLNDDTALHIAVERNVGLDIIKLILNRPDLNINHKKNGTTTVLHTASRKRLTDVMMLLKTYGAEDIHQRNDSEEISESENDDEADNDEDMEEVDEGTSPSLECCGAEVATDYPSPSNVSQLIESMKCMSLKGANRTRLIELLLNGDINLKVTELQQVIKSSFRTLVNKYRDTDNDRLELKEVLDRFNCLPNSMGQLFEKLKDIGRMDIIEKVTQHFINPT